VGPEGSPLDVKPDGEGLTLEQVEQVAREGARVVLPQKARKRMADCRRALEGMLRAGETVYGANTGFGKLADTRIEPEKTEELQRRLVLSHAAGLGEPLAAEVVRAAMLLRLNTFAKGHSAVRVALAETLVRMLNAPVTPYVHSIGSLGASGDLAPLSEIALLVQGRGLAMAEDGRAVDGRRALQGAGIEPLKLASREGLGLINGTQVMTAAGALALLDLEHLLKAELVATAVVADALGARRSAYDKRVFEARPHPGAVRSADALRRMLRGGDLDHSLPKSLQDAYSIRCAPQIIGASLDSAAFARRTFEVELNSATDNPLLFPEDGEQVSGGNFHGEPVAQALDLLSIAIADLATLSERHTNRLLNPALSGMPPFLASEPGLDSGLMMAQYTAAALVEELRALARPATVDSASTSADQEDHVSLGMHSALKARRGVELLRNVVAIELVAGIQALDFRAPKRPAGGVAEVYNLVRRIVPFYNDDRPLNDDLMRVTELLRIGEVVRVAEARVGPL
jgi:histidine ammonia-lyase